MENHTTLPGILTVPGELMPHATRRAAARRVRRAVAGAVIAAGLALAWWAWH